MRGGKREGSGRKTIDNPKQIKSFTLSREAIEALKNLEVVMDKASQSELIESLLLSAWAEIEKR
jgi:hypothetical protein